MSPIKEIESIEQYENEVIKAAPGVLVVVDFYGPWCGPCKQLLPHIEKFQDDFPNAVFRKFNIGNEDLEEYAADLGVAGLPTVFLYKDGKPVHQFQGNREQNLLRDIQNHY